MSAHVGTVVNSLNVFVDTSQDVGDGDNAHVQLSENAINCGDGQILKVTLAEFSMYRNFYTVNATNAKFRLTADSNLTELELLFQNYRSVADIADAFATALATQLTTDTGVTCTPATVLPAAGTLVNSTDDRIISFNLGFSAAHNLTTFRVQCFTAVSDSFALLGGDRIDDAASTESSFDCTVVNATTLRVVGRYPAQRSTMSHLYVRTNLRSNNIETVSLSASQGPFQTHTLTSNILARIPVDIEFCTFTSGGAQDEFFLLLSQKQLSSMKLFLTDHKGRPLGRVAGSASKTAAGSGTAQSTRGNLNFLATLRIDVLQRSEPNALKTAPIPRSVPGRFINPLIWEDYGEAKE